MFFRMTLIFLCVCAGVSCARADEKATANKIFVETVQLLKQAAAAKPSEAVGLYEKALRNLDNIVANYPGSDLAVQIISGQAIGQVNRSSIETALNEARQTTQELAREELERKELEKLRGPWQVSELIEDGKPVPEEERKTMTVVFFGHLMDLMMESRTWSMKFKLDPAKKPKAFDSLSGEMLGIYELDGDTLKVCLGKTERPKEFKASQGSDCSGLLILKRSKS